MHVVYVTAGTVGVGDLMHGVALRRAVARAGLPWRVSLVSPTLPFPALMALPDHHAVPFEMAALLDPQQALTTTLAATLSALKADVVVVGHFWAPLLHVLPALGVPAVLLLRKAPPSWVQGPPQAPFQPGHFSHIFEIEPVGFGVVGAASLPPMVVANPDELLDRRAARDALGIRDDLPRTLVFQAGLPGETRTLQALVPAGAKSTVIDAAAADAPFPMARLLRAGDAFITGAGYNAVWESVWLGTWKDTRFQAFPRRIDDQVWRVGCAAQAQMRDNGADVLVAHLRCGASPPGPRLR